MFPQQYINNIITITSTLVLPSTITHDEDIEFLCFQLTSHISLISSDVSGHVPSTVYNIIIITSTLLLPSLINRHQDIVTTLLLRCSLDC